MTRLTSALTALVLTFTATAALAGPPTKFLDEQVKSVRVILAKKIADGTPEAAEADKQLMSIIAPVMEFDQLSQNALRKHWPKLEPAQRTTFVDLFRELVFRSYLKRVRSANEEYSIEYEDEERTGQKSADVSAVAKTKKAEIELVFKLEARDAGRWVAADVVIDEVSIVENYREQFNKIIAEEGFAALLGKMRKKLRELGSPLGAEPAAEAKASKDSK